MPIPHRTEWRLLKGYRAYIKELMATESTEYSQITPTLHKSPLPPEGVAKDIRATVGCAVRTIPNKELRLPNGAHGAPYIAFTTPSTGEGLFLEFTGSELKNHRQTARYP